MDLYSEIYKSHTEDLVEMQQTLVDLQIAAEEKTRAKYESEIQNLKNQLAQLEKKDKETKEKIQELSEELEKYPSPPDSAYTHGDFFHRLNACEVFDAQLNGKIEGQKQVEKNMLALIKKQELVNEKLQQKFEQICQQIPGGFVDPEQTNRSGDERPRPMKNSQSIYKSSKNKEVRRLLQQVDEGRASLQSLDDQFREITDEIQATQKNIRKVTQELKEKPQFQTDELVLQTAQLTKEIQNKKIQLHKIEEEYKNEQAKAERSSRLGIDHDMPDKKSTSSDDRWMDRQKAILESRQSAQQISSEETWSKEREALLQSIKNTKLEIRNLKKQEALNDPSSATQTRRLSTTNSKNPPENTKTFLRKAMQMELDLINSGKHPVLIAIRNEMEYQSRLDKNLEEVEKTNKTIDDFSKKLFGNRTGKEDDDDYDNKKQRIDMLKAELAELRKQIGE